MIPVAAAGQGGFPGLVERYSPPVLIDEIQYVPELLHFIKIVIDEQRFRAP